jgi:hypothetical protein
MKTARLLLVFVCAAMTMMALTASAAPPTSFVGEYEGESIQRTPHVRDLVESLEISEKDGVYTLKAFMNAVNREPGMDSASNTIWQWSGEGALQNGALSFKYTSEAHDPGAGSIRQEGKRLVLTLDSVRYRLQRAKKPERKIESRFGFARRQRARPLGRKANPQNTTMPLGWAPAGTAGRGRITGESSISVRVPSRATFRMCSALPFGNVSASVVSWLTT